MYRSTLIIGFAIIPDSLNIIENFFYKMIVFLSDPGFDGAEIYWIFNYYRIIQQLKFYSISFRIYPTNSQAREIQWSPHYPTATEESSSPFAIPIFRVESMMPDLKMMLSS